MLSLKPFVRMHFDKVLRWQGIEERYCKGKVVVLANLALFQNELLVVQNLLRISILYHYPERFCPPMESGVPLELFMGLQFKLNPHSASSDRLHEG